MSIVQRTDHRSSSFQRFQSFISLDMYWHSIEMYLKQGFKIFDVCLEMYRTSPFNSINIPYQTRDARLNFKRDCHVFVSESEYLLPSAWNFWKMKFISIWYLVQKTINRIPVYMKGIMRCSSFGVFFLTAIQWMTELLLLASYEENYNTLLTINSAYVVVFRRFWRIIIVLFKQWTFCIL